MDPITLVQTAISLAVKAKALIDRVKKQDDEVMDLRLRLHTIEYFLNNALISNRCAVVATVAIQLASIAGNEERGLVHFLTAYEANLMKQNGFSMKAVFGFATKVAYGDSVQEQLMRYNERLKTVQGDLDAALQISTSSEVLEIKKEVLETKNVVLGNAMEAIYQFEPKPTPFDDERCLSLGQGRGLCQNI